MDDTNSRVIADAAPSFPSFIALRARHSELLQREPDSEEAKVECLKDVEQFIKQAQATGAILSGAEERESGQNILNYWVSTLYRQDQVARLVTLAEYKSKLTEIGDVSCPYPGVRAFTEKDSQFFFGRQRQIDYLVGRLKEDRLLVIVGASGSGKTSLVQAGLLPAIKKEEINDVKHFFFLPIVPGSEPLRSLALMIQSAKDPGGDDPQWLQEQVERFKRDNKHLLKLIEKTTDDPVVIFIDQGELLYERSVHVLLRPLENILDFDNSKKTIEPFLDNLIGVVQSSGRNHIVIIARRTGDFEPYTKRLPSRVREVFEPARVVLPALYSSELRDAIEKPAELLGVKFDEAITGPDEMAVGEEVKSTETTVQALVREISGEPVGLPLLQFTLSRLWEKREGNRIPHRAFREIVSCRAELSATAEDFYNSLQFFEQLTCRRLLTQLVKIDRELNPHVYPLRRQALYRRREKHGRVDSLIERLTEKQLIRITRGEVPADDCIELTHASLLRNWPRMSAWVESKRWARRRSQAIKVVGVAAVIAVVMLAGFLIIGWQQQRTRSRDLARLSNKQLANGRFDLALLLGLAAYQTEINSATRSNLHNLLYNLQFTPQPKRFLRRENFKAIGLAFTAESDRPPSRVAAINLEGKVVVWDLNWEKGKPTATEIPLLQDKVARSPLIFSPDGTTLATASADPSVKIILWNLTTGQHQNLSVNGATDTPAAEALESVFRILGLVFRSDGEALFSAAEDGSVIRWDLKGPGSMKATTIFKHTLPINSIDLNAKENLLAAGDNDGSVFLLDVSGKAVRSRVITPGHTTATVGDEAIYSVAFNSDGQLLAASRIDAASVWQTETGKLQREFYTGLSPTGLFVTFNDQDRLLGYNTDGNIFSWNVQLGVPSGSRLYKPANPSRHVSFSNNGKFLALPSDDGAIVWDLANQRSLTGNVQINSIAFKPGVGEPHVLAVGEESGVVLWEAKNTNEHREVDSFIEESEVLSIDYSPDGSVLAAGLNNATISLRDSLTLTETATLKRDQELQDGEEYAGVVKTVFDPRRDSRQIVGVVNLRNTKTRQSFSEIIFWDLTSGKQIRKLPLKENSVVTDLAFRPDGELLVWTSRDNENRSTVAFWDSIKNEHLRNLDRPNVKNLAFSPNGKVMAVGLDRGRVEIWDEAYERTASLEALPDEVVDLAFSPDGSILACATNPRSSHEADLRPGTIVLWDMNEEPPEQLGDSFKGHADAISNISFSPDGRILASGSKDKDVLLWDVNVAEARKQFCEIIDCPGTFKQLARRLENETWSEWLYRKTIKGPSIDNETWFQWLYRKAMRKPSLEELHQ